MNNFYLKTISCLIAIGIITPFYVITNNQTNVTIGKDEFTINVDENEILETRTELNGDQQQRSIISSSISSTDLSSSSSSSSSSSPQIVWLMSFPNSGTSYTLHLVHKISNKIAIATNYEQEIEYGKPIPFSSQLSPYGPFMLKDEHMNAPKINKSKSNNLYHHHVLTKTHCAGYCMDCKIEGYFIDRYEFLRGCATNRLLSKHHHDYIHHSNMNSTANNSTNSNTSTDHKNDHVGITISRTMTRTRLMEDKSAVYDYRISPKKVIRLVRDPFDNVVSNFHNWLNQQSRKGTGLDKGYAKDEKGFMDYCLVQNMLFQKKFKQEKDASLKQFFIDLKKLLINVPCHQHFFRYVNWHNNANFATKHLDTLIIQYDDYERNMNATTHKILNFLELDYMGNAGIPPFKVGKTYRHDHFSHDQILATSKLIRHLAQPATLDLISPYLI